MVTAVFFYADHDDTLDLMRYLGLGDTVSLHPWPLVKQPQARYTLEEAIAAGSVMVQSSELGGPVLLRDGDSAFDTADRAGLFNRLNRERLQPGPRDGYLVDPNRAPVLFWQPGASRTGELRTSSIGSQADSMAAVSIEYERWANRVMSWVRRRGTAVWGVKTSAVRPDLNVDVRFLNSVYALPGAMKQLEAGVAGR